MNLRTVRIVMWSAVAAIVSLVVLDRAGAFGYRGDDWSRFNQKPVRAIEVIDGDTFCAELESGEAVPVRLLGVDAPEIPDAHWSAEAKKYTEARLANRTVTLRLDGTQTRDDAGNLLAYVFILDTDCLNVDIVRDAQAFADRRIKHTLSSPIETAETDARKKRRGMWRELTDDQQPAWRQAWLRELQRRRNN